MAKEAIKENLNKLSFVDIPIEAVEALAKVFQTSKNSGKYPRDNHFKPIKNTELIDAIFRHLIEVIKGKRVNNQIADQDIPNLSDKLTQNNINYVLIQLLLHVVIWFYLS